MTMHKPTMAELARAHDESGLRGSLADALQSPLLARCLALTAEAIAARAPDYRPPPAAPPRWPVRPITTHHHDNHPRRDVKRASAGDKEDEP